MNKFSLLILSCFISMATFAQTKKLTLEDGVLQQNRQFRADKLLGFQWIPNTNRYIFFAESGKKLMTASTANTKATELVTLADLNKVLGTDLKSFFGIEWKDADNFTIANVPKFFVYNTETKTGKPGEALRYRADVPHKIVNVGQGEAHAVMVLALRQTGQGQ